MDVALSGFTTKTEHALPRSAAPCEGKPWGRTRLCSFLARLTHISVTKDEGGGTIQHTSMASRSQPPHGTMTPTTNIFHNNTAKLEAWQGHWSRLLLTRGGRTWPDWGQRVDAPSQIKQDRVYQVRLSPAQSIGLHLLTPKPERGRPFREWEGEREEQTFCLQ